MFYKFIFIEKKTKKRHTVIETSNRELAWQNIFNPDLFDVSFFVIESVHEIPKIKVSDDLTWKQQTQCLKFFEKYKLSAEYLEQVITSLTFKNDNTSCTSEDWEKIISYLELVGSIFDNLLEKGVSLSYLFKYINREYGFPSFELNFNEWAQVKMNLNRIINSSKNTSWKK